MIKKNFLFITSSCLIPILSLWSQNFGSTEEEENSCVFKNLGGTLPNRVCHIREFLKKVKSMPKPDTSIKSTNTLKEFGEAYIFYGDTGIGKTTTAKLISEEAGVLLEFHQEVDVSSEIKATNNPSAVISKIYKNAEERVEKEKKPIVIVIDEIDKIFRNNPEAIETICGALRSKIDKHENNPYIITVLTSNTVKGLDSPMLRRCMQVQWFKPSQKNREEIIKFFAKQYNVELSENFVKEMAAKTSEFTGAHFKFAFNYAYKESFKLNEIIIKRNIEMIQKEIDAKKTTFAQHTTQLIIEYPKVAVTVVAGVTYAIVDGIYYLWTKKHLPRPDFGKK